jgi:hypothetical protein
MVNWYYVSGSERVGPVGEDVLRDLFQNEEINQETYIWKKGFSNWERLKDVTELNFEQASAPASEIIKQAPAQRRDSKVLEEFIEKVEVQSFDDEETGSPEVTFKFNWKTLRENDELFFVRIGRDRKKFNGTDIFGPYSLVELKEALEEKRVNLFTLIFSPGMSSWTAIEDTPLNKEFTGKTNNTISLNEIPLMMVFDYFPIPLITVVKKSGALEGVLLGAGPFTEFEDKIVKASLYLGNELKVKDVKVKVSSYEKKSQVIECQFIDLHQDAKRIMLNHAL